MGAGFTPSAHCKRSRDGCCSRRPGTFCYDMDCARSVTGPKLPERPIFRGAPPSTPRRSRAYLWYGSPAAIRKPR